MPHFGALHSVFLCEIVFVNLDIILANLQKNKKKLEKN